jgi:hypothetical protein
MVRSMAGDEMRERFPGIFDAVRRVDGVQISPDFTRVLVHYLGQLSRIYGQQNGCAPADLVAAQHALAEAVVAHDSRRHEVKSVCAPNALGSGHDLVDTETAAAMLGLKADTVRWHFRQGNLHGRRVGRQLMVSLASIESLKVRLGKKKGA